MELSDPKLKKLLKFSQKSFSYIRETKTPKILLIFQKETFRAQKIHSEKTSYISGNGTFLPQV